MAAPRAPARDIARRGLEEVLEWPVMPKEPDKALSE
jgi:hypothetical protein